jgi:hypothetical protein
MAPKKRVFSSICLPRSLAESVHMHENLTSYSEIESHMHADDGQPEDCLVLEDPIARHETTGLQSPETIKRLLRLASQFRLLVRVR